MLMWDIHENGERIKNPSVVHESARRSFDVRAQNIDAMSPLFEQDVSHFSVSIKWILLRPGSVSFPLVDVSDDSHLEQPNNLDKSRWILPKENEEIDVDCAAILSVAFTFFAVYFDENMTGHLDGRRYATMTEMNKTELQSARATNFVCRKRVSWLEGLQFSWSKKIQKT